MKSALALAALLTTSQGFASYFSLSSNTGPYPVPPVSVSCEKDGVTTTQKGTAIFRMGSDLLIAPYAPFEQAWENYWSYRAELVPLVGSCTINVGEGVTVGGEVKVDEALPEVDPSFAQFTTRGTGPIKSDCTVQVEGQPLQVTVTNANEIVFDSESSSLTAIGFGPNRGDEGFAELAGTCMIRIHPDVVLLEN